jgi:hypothetical protein
MVAGLIPDNVGRQRSISERRQMVIGGGHARVHEDQRTWRTNGTLHDSNPACKRPLIFVSDEIQSF